MSQRRANGPTLFPEEVPGFSQAWHFFRKLRQVFSQDWHSFRKQELALRKSDNPQHAKSLAMGPPMARLL